MATTIYSWEGIDSEKLNTKFSVERDGITKFYTVSYNTELVVNMSCQRVEAHWRNIQALDYEEYYYGARENHDIKNANRR